jgi:hypothetical protein
MESIAQDDKERAAVTGIVPGPHFTKTTSVPLIS